MKSRWTDGRLLAVPTQASPLARELLYPLYRERERERSTPRRAARRGTADRIGSAQVLLRVDRVKAPDYDRVQRRRRRRRRRVVVSLMYGPDRPLARPLINCIPA